MMKLRWNLISYGDMKTEGSIGIDRRKCLKWMMRKWMNKGWELLRGEDSGRKCVAWAP